MIERNGYIRLGEGPFPKKSVFQKNGCERGDFIMKSGRINKRFALLAILWKKTGASRKRDTGFSLLFVAFLLNYTLRI